MKLILGIAMACCFSSLAAQVPRRTPPAGVTLQTTSSGAGYMLKPDKSAEWMKNVINISKDKTGFSPVIKEYKDGEYVVDSKDDDWILRANLNKGDKAVFELVPDLSKSGKLSLFVYTGSSMWIKTRYATAGKTLKYIRYEKTDAPDKEGIVPLLLVYEDTSSGNAEKKISKISVGGRLPVKYIADTSLLKELSHYMIVYYRLKN